MILQRKDGDKDKENELKQNVSDGPNPGRLRPNEINRNDEGNGSGPTKCTHPGRSVEGLDSGYSVYLGCGATSG